MGMVLGKFVGGRVESLYSLVKKGGILGDFWNWSRISILC
jgi:hypothetical protein